MDGRLELKALAIVELEKETETDSEFDVDETPVVGLDEEVWMDESPDSKEAAIGELCEDCFKNEKIDDGICNWLDRTNVTKPQGILNCKNEK